MAIKKIKALTGNKNFQFRLVVKITDDVNASPTFMQIDGLKNQFAYKWDEHSQSFIGRSKDVAHNNDVVENVLSELHKLNDENHPRTGKDLKALFSGVGVTDDTFGGYLQSLIEKMRTEKNKRPSRNYQVYRNLLHKLQAEGKIINTPIADINNKSFRDFGAFLLSLSWENGKSNYANLMKYFKQVHAHAVRDEKNTHTLVYEYLKDAPTKDMEKKPSLSEQQVSCFFAIDPLNVPSAGVNTAFYNSLYYDFVTFMYETTTRPCDVMRLHANNVIEKDGKFFLDYIPEKKKNYRTRDKRCTRPLSDTALTIINKYRGQSAEGFLFPFSMNNYHWDFTNPDSWNTWNNRKNRALEMVNRWLKKVAEMIDVKFSLTLYTFRHTAFTLQCKQPNANLLRIALYGATSVDMLQKNYVDSTLI